MCENARGAIFYTLWSFRSSPMKSTSISSTTDLSPLPPLDLLLVPSPLPHEVSFSDTSAQLIAEARATFVRLEREAEVRPH